MMTKVRDASTTPKPSGSGSNNKTKYERLRRKSLGFIASLFKLTRGKNNCLTGMRIDSGRPNDQDSSRTMQHRSPRLESTGVIAASSGSRDTNDNGGGGGVAEAANVSRISSTLSVAAVDVVLACRQAAGGATKASPSHSILTLTPGRTRNIDQDMEALRLSRQDNPYLQILASKENLIESIDESESDDAILMSQEFRDTDPLTLAQVHEHLVRSPPPASWTRTSMFHFPHQQQQQDGSHCRNSSPRSLLHRSSEERAVSEESMDIRDRHSHTFSLLNPTPIRSLSEVRRLHRSAEDSVQLMSSD